jgi:glutamate--cysteine ligase
LYGASPAICSSFVKKKNSRHVLKYDDTTFFMPFATSLRSGDLGYQSKVQREHVRISYNGLSEYATSLKKAIRKQHRAYVLLDNLPKNEKSQISPNLLQSEAEFYTSIRAKTNLQTGENFIKSLLNGGVEYVELRLLDLNPFSPAGITEEQIRFLDIFLLFCLVSKSQKDDRKTEDDSSHNHFLTALEGRNRETILSDAGNERKLYSWANEILDSFKELSDFLDKIEGSTRYSESLKQQRKLIKDPELTPSGKMLIQMQEREISFLDFGISKAKEYRDYYNGAGLHPNELKFLQDISNKSHGAAKKLEGEPSNHFDGYLKDFLSGYND